MTLEMFDSGLTKMTNACRLAGLKIERTLDKPEVQAVLQGAEKQASRTLTSLERTAMSASEAMQTMSKDLVRSWSGQMPPVSPGIQTGVAAGSRDAGGGIAGGFVGGTTGASSWMRRFSGSASLSPATSPLTTPRRMTQRDFDLQAGNLNAEERQLQWALDASLAGQRASGYFQRQDFCESDAEDDVLPPLPFEFTEDL